MSAVSHESAPAGKTDEAVEAYRRYLQASPDRGSIWLELARTETWRGNYGAASTRWSGYHTRLANRPRLSASRSSVGSRRATPRAEEVLEPLLRQDADNYDLTDAHGALATQGHARGIRRAGCCPSPPAGRT